MTRRRWIVNAATGLLVPLAHGQIIPGRSWSFKRAARRPFGGLIAVTGSESHWRLDEASGNAIDVGPGGHTLTSINSVGSAAGKIGGARQFIRASSQYFSSESNIPSLSVGDNDLTIACWCLLNSTGTAQVLVSKWTATGNQKEYSLFYMTDRFYFFASTDGTSEAIVAANKFGEPSTGQWYFVVGQHDSVNDRLRISVNAGTPDVSGSYTGGIFEGTSNFYIGRSNSGTTWDGLIDSVTLDKRLWSPAEIAAAYNSGNGLDY